MKSKSTYNFPVKILWIYPLLFGIIGALLGLVLRYAYTGSLNGFQFKNVLHSHSHVMLLGFIFNALLIAVWSKFTIQIDKVTHWLFLILQICIAVFLVAFIVQGYAFYSILFSTIHLWVSYILLIRLWQKLNHNNPQSNLIKLGIVFHFISSIGPYMLGPLMVLEMQGSPWYQQAIFFYLHFQYFGLFFVWMLALLFQKAQIRLTKKQFILLTVSLVFLYAHSLDFSFNHWLIQFFGGLGALVLFVLLINFIKRFNSLRHNYKFLYFGVLLISFLNILGSVPIIANLVVENRFILIAWLHLLFLGMYTPFIWLSLPKKTPAFVWVIYGMSFLFSQIALVFPHIIFNFLSLPLMWSLFWSYAILTMCICFVHISNILIFRNKHTILPNPKG